MTKAGGGCGGGGRGSTTRGGGGGGGWAGWRVRWGPVVLKVYDKARRVLRVEVKVLNTAGLGCGKGLGKLGEQLECVQGMRERFLASRQAAHRSEEHTSELQSR